MSAVTAPTATAKTSTTNDIISDAQARSFVDDGFLVVPRLVSADEIEQLKRETIAIARGAYPCKSIQPAPAHLSDRDVTENLLCIHQPHFLSPVMRAFTHNAGINAVLARTIAAHLPNWDGAVKCMQSMLFVKPPSKPGQSWHQDEMYIPTRDRSLCGAWIAIDDATIENGCLWVVPGSHRNGYLFPNRPPTDLQEYDGSPQCHGFDENTAIPVPVKAGSVVFFNGYLLHKSLRNRSTVYRRALVSHYMNAWSLLPWAKEAEMRKRDDLWVAQLDNRCILQTAGTDPYAWKGYEPLPDDVYLRTFHKVWAKDKATVAIS